LLLANRENRDEGLAWLECFPNPFSFGCHCDRQALGVPASQLRRRLRPMTTGFVSSDPAGTIRGDFAAARFPRHALNWADFHGRFGGGGGSECIREATFRLAVAQSVRE
jgi:hypothetical protein